MSCALAGRASLGSLSESVAIFDPALLKEIAAELGHTIRSKPSSQFAAVRQRITAVDGTVLETMKRVAELAWTPKAGGKHLSAYRLHTHFEVLSGRAVRIDATPAELIAEMERRRWIIEMFFRTFKQLLGCRHLLSGKHNGVEIQAYCAMIVCMLILIYTGEKPNRAMDQMVWYELIGLASLKELEVFIASRKEPVPAQPRPHVPVGFAAAPLSVGLSEGLPVPREPGYGSKRSQDGEAQ
ncbi:MAG: transposase, partial [Pirellulales bacterium]